MTKRQADCLRAIEDLTVGGMSPSYDEIAARLGITSKGEVCRLVGALEQRGRIRRHRKRSRALEVMSAVVPGQSKVEIADEICRLVWEWSGRSRPTDELFPLVLGALR